MSSVGLDIGGSFLKAAWLDDSRLHVTRLQTPSFLDISGKAREINPTVLMDAVSALLDEVIGARQCERIFISGQMAGLAFVDDRGRATGPLLSWQDTRFDDIDRVRRALPPDELPRLGDGLRVGQPLVTLSQLEIPSGAYVTSLIGFVAAALTSSFPSSIHATDAASFGMLNVEDCEWSEAALAVTRISPDRLSTPTWNVTSVGLCSRYGAEVFTPVGDQQSALLGVGLEFGQVSMNIATGCQVSVISRSTRTPAQLRPYFDELFLHTRTHLPAGRMLASALASDLGRTPDPVDWEVAVQNREGRFSATDSALAAIAGACVDAALLLCQPKEVVFSGGIPLRAPRLRELIAELLPVHQVVYEGEDASISGLQQLSKA